MHPTECNFDEGVLRRPKKMIHFWTGWYGSCRYSSQIFVAPPIEFPEVQFCKCDIVRSRRTTLRLCVGMTSGEMFSEGLNATFRFNAVA
jgi:hypothetical protein